MRNNHIVVLTVLVGMGAFFIGVAFGYGNAIDLCVKAAARIIDFNIDPALLEDILIRYSNK